MQHATSTIANEMRRRRKNQKHHDGEIPGVFSFGIAVATTIIDLTDRFAIFGDSALALFISLLLLMFALLTLVLDETNDGEGITE
mmetsp:Transcript_17932/g.39111  ORF Transcript_17932/g.39111 Transcript_17932/m.39111 type:complete len:85 (-) Transcript_17932:2793-3047(-)